MLSIRFVLSETVAMVSLSAPPTIVHIRRWAVSQHGARRWTNNAVR